MRLKRRLQEKFFTQTPGRLRWRAGTFQFCGHDPVHSADEVAMRSESFNLFQQPGPSTSGLYISTVSLRFCSTKRVRPTKPHCFYRVQGICVYSVEPFPCSSD